MEAKNQQPCMYFYYGSCPNGSQCLYSHDDAVIEEFRKYVEDTRRIEKYFTGIDYRWTKIQTKIPRFAFLIVCTYLSTKEVVNLTRLNKQTAKDL